jgi:hypothetical protein
MEPLDFRGRADSLLAVRFFALGLVGLLALGVAGATAPGALVFPPPVPGILVLHLAALGWITPVMLGADYQLLPVVLHRPIRAPWVAGPIFWAYAAGTTAFLLGLGTGRPPLVAAGGLLTGAALLAFCAHAFAALVGLRTLGPTALGLGGGLVCLAAVAILGPWMALGLGAGAAVPFAALLPLHAAAALAGWLLLTIQGATYQLVPLFAATPPQVSPRHGVVAVACTGCGVLLLAAAALRPALPAALGALVVWGGLTLWVTDVVRLVRHGRQARREAVVRYSVLAVAAIWLAAGGGALALLGVRLPVGALGYLGLVAGPSLLILGQLHKILPFLAALDASLAAKRRGQVPKTEELFPRHRAFQLLWVFAPAFTAAVAGMALGWPLLVRAAGLLVAAASCAYILQAAKALATWRAARGR